MVRFLTIFTLQEKAVNSKPEPKNDLPTRFWLNLHLFNLPCYVDEPLYIIHKEDCLDKLLCTEKNLQE